MSNLEDIPDEDAGIDIPTYHSLEPNQSSFEPTESTPTISVSVTPSPKRKQEAKLEPSISPLYRPAANQPVTVSSSYNPNIVEVDASPEASYMVAADQTPAPRPMSVEKIFPSTSDESPLMLIPSLFTSPSSLMDARDGENENRTALGASETSYQSLVLGKNTTYAMGSHPLVYKGPSLDPGSGNESQIVFVYARNSNITTTNRLETSIMTTSPGTSDTSHKALKIQVYVHSTGHSLASVPTARASVYAFRRDPQFSNPGLLAASSTQPQAITLNERNTVTLEVPTVVNSSIYILLSVRASFRTTNVSVLSTPLVVAAPREAPWNAVALTGGPANFSAGVQDRILSYVYLLSSAPYTQHIELKDASFDLSGLKALSSPLGNPETAPFCNSKGTEMAAALVGRHLGSADRATIIPVPIRSCTTSASDQTLSKAFSWVRGHMDRNHHAHYLVVVEDSEHIHRSLKSLAEIIKEISGRGALVFLPGSSCHRKNESYISVGPYGIRDDGRLEVLSMNISCSQEFDIFAPGLSVLGASTIGPYAYRNISISADIAAAGAAGVIINVVQDQGGKVLIDDLKRIFQTKLRLSTVFAGRTDSAPITLPLLGVQSRHELSTALVPLVTNSSQSNGNKVASSFIPNLSNGALIGICAAAGVIIVTLILGGVLVTKRNRAETSDSSCTSGSTSYSEDREGGRHDGEQDAHDTTVPALPIVHVNVQSDNQMTDRPAAIQDAVLERKTSSANTPAKGVPLVQILRSLSKSKDSPATPNAKASWFATPKGSETQGHPPFGDDTDVVSEGGLSQAVLQVDTAESLPVLNGPENIIDVPQAGDK